MNRQKQLWALIGLTALTMAPQYAMQGWLATGGNLDGLGSWFPKLDSAAWALRALIEAWALLYLFSTPAKDERQARLLAAFEVALIVLIVVTLGPALATAGSNETMRDYLKGHWYLAWNFMVASYAPLMLGAAGFASKLENQARIAETSEAESATESADQPTGTARKTRKISAPKRDKKRSEAEKTREKALEIIAENPAVTGADLARELGKHPSTGRKLKAELLPLVEAGEVEPMLNGHGPKSE